MTTIRRFMRVGAVTLVSASLLGVGACGQSGALGSVLGSVLGGQQQQGGQVSGTVRGVDTRNAQITIQQSNGQSVNIGYDNQTKVSYQNQNYTVANLESGDQVTLRVQQTQNGGYYTDFVQVDQSVSSSGSSNRTDSQTQSFQGTVRRVDTTNGWFEFMPNNNVTLTVTLPYNVSRTDQQRFQNLRNGDNVRFTGVYLNNTRVELRQFY